MKICCSHAGVSVGEDGGSHQAIEDIGLMRLIPGMTVIVPADAKEARKATLAWRSSGSGLYASGLSGHPRVRGGLSL